ncbi:hypothetical protein ACI75Y_02960 [Capnocytophaga stomatis]|uniref:hypothetical protein n=1 Tax=Capnocytophaga stomatis TaxID=1848904 RepID=UPI00385BC5F8
MTNNVIYTKLDVSMKSGEKHFSDNTSLEKGTCVGVEFVPFSKQHPDFSLNIEVKNSQGGVLLDSTDFRSYIHKGGGFFNGMKQVNFPTDNNRFFISLNSEKQLENDLNGQLIFAIKREEEQ